MVKMEHGVKARISGISMADTGRIPDIHNDRLASYRVVKIVSVLRP